MNTIKTEGQKVNNLKIKGSFWDDSTGVDLACTIYGYKNGKLVNFGLTNSANQFEIEIPVDLDSISFFSQNYSTVTVPIKFYGDFKKKSLAFFSLRTKRLGQIIVNNDFVIYCKPENQDVIGKYEIHHILKDTLHCKNDITKALTNNLAIWDLGLYSASRTLKFVFTSSNYDVLESEIIKTVPGLTFVDLNHFKKSKIDFLEHKPKYVDNFTIKFETKTLYFKQSKYNLTLENTKILDSLLMLMNLNPNLKVKVNGFTDNVGNNALNKTLAENRAIVVTNYLLKKGIPSNRIKTMWKLEGDFRKIEYLNLDLSKNRKVTISEY